MLDADALTCFQNDLKTLYSLLDKNKIITPHLGEFHKIFPKIKRKMNNIKKVKYALKLIKSNILLKGAFTKSTDESIELVKSSAASSDSVSIDSV